MRPSPTEAVSRRVLPVAVVLVVLVGAAGTAVALDRAAGYHVDVVLPSAVGITTGQPVLVAGRDTGRVVALAARDNAAVATLDLDEDVAPLHAGTVVRVEWRSVLGEHAIAVEPGPATNPELPDGALIPAATAQVTVEDLLETLDGPTRVATTGTVRELAGTLAGREGDLNATLRTAGPSVEALGAVLAAVGSDGPAIEDLVVRTREVTTVLAGRRDGLASTVTDLSALTEAVAAQQQALTDGLVELPSTLRSATAALDAVPAATDAAVPLLDDLAPGVARLPAVAADLRPVLADLRPVVADLRPTLQAADVLLDRTPGLLDGTAATLPQLTEAAGGLGPTAAFLRPYTPELTGFLGNWGNLFAGYDGQGHHAHTLITFGPTSYDDLPPGAPTGGAVVPRPAPGSSGGQPWVDAFGDGPR